MTQPERSSENNTITVSGSTFTSSPIAAGSHAQASVTVSSASEAEQGLASAVDELREALRQAQATVDRRDDETRESLELAASRLTALEEEMQARTSKPDWARVKKLMAGIRDALTGMASLTTSADALWTAVEKVVR